MSNEQRPESFDERFRRRSHSFENDDFEKDNTDEVADTESGVETETFSSKETDDYYVEPREKRNGGCLSSVLLPLIAGIVGAILVVMLYHTFFDGDTPVTDNNTDQTESKELNEVKKDLEEEHSDKVITDTTAAVEKASPAVVSVINLQETQSLYGLGAGEIQEAGSGSGVIYKIDDNNAYIVTNNHVIEGASELKVNLESGESIPAELVGTDIWTDLAVLRVERGNIDVAIEFADSDKVLVGEDAIAIGSPLGAMLSGSVSRGIVSALDRAIPVDFDNDGVIDWEANVLQTDAAINPGNSGGALINSDGDLIGINSMKIGQDNVEGIGFAIPSNEVTRIIKDLEEHGEVKRPFLGVSMMDLYTISSDILQGQLNLPEDVTAGALVTGVQENSPADIAGLREYDVIVSLDGEKIENSLKLRRYLYEKKEIGDEITIEFYRDGEKQSTTATLE
ncbi:serine protease [Phocicoccus schoeneichii]|uniref:Serine protease Do-like HtrA n=1 Tax=Phocicoccus schoeneichii TaxID=1812261 RepID=A0A6V7R6F4_9BACL|nr:S1C family serine protease [Jeotgalicoccus schoeneichii]GGH50273.1 serine protease [Jeotgalicoccus schoeneichii]CAD2072970.1 Serine protease Do-like HtrA [Jeotgalicoccus schoeneichii]